jgi:hypothetical protein
MVFQYVERSKIKESDKFQKLLSVEFKQHTASWNEEVWLCLIKDWKACKSTDHIYELYCGNENGDIDKKFAKAFIDECIKKGIIEIRKVKEKIPRDKEYLDFLTKIIARQIEYFYGKIKTKKIIQKGSLHVHIAELVNKYLAENKGIAPEGFVCTEGSVCHYIDKRINKAKRVSKNNELIILDDKKRSNK